VARSTILLLFLTAAGAIAPAAAQRPPEHPNIVVYVADDLGWRDTGVYGNSAVDTPNIDRIARSGLVVRYAFVTSPQCSPSRISILTGRYPHTTRTEDLHTPTPAGVRILPSYLQAAGYFTGMMAKTHLGPEAERQFQWYSPETAAALPAFLDSAGTRPFFLWVAFHEPHRPYDTTAPPRHSPSSSAVTPYLVSTRATRTDIARYYDAIATMDRKIGEMTAELARRGLAGNMLVVFLSDNGAPFPREKGTLYDGGTRTPLLLSWPGVIRPGTVYERAPVSLVDLMPTLLEVAGSPPDSLVQGRSLRAMLTAPESYAPQRYVFTERNWHDCDEHQRAVRDGRWKLIRTDAYTALPLCTAADIGTSPSFQALRARATAAPARLTPAQRRLFEAPRARLELYDLAKDPWEVTNLAGDPAHAARVRRLAAVLQEWMEGTDDFPSAWRVRDDNTDRITGLPFSPWIPPLRDSVPPPREQRWGTRGPS
jgi:N-sulfoglucosamine sulfohydrolase